MWSAELTVFHAISTFCMLHPADKQDARRYVRWCVGALVRWLGLVTWCFMSESITRRNLPHWYMPDVAHFVTFRISGTIPKSTLKRWRDVRSEEVRNRSQTAVNAHKRFFAAYDAYLDRGAERLWLANADVAKIMGMRCTTITRQSTTC